MPHRTKPKKKRGVRAELEKEAARLVADQGFFFLVYDVVDSRGESERLGSNGRGLRIIMRKLREFNDNVAIRFRGEILRKNVGGRPLTFSLLIGDSGGGHFNTSDVIAPIMKIADLKLKFKLRWAVARDEWDREGLSIIR